MTGIYFIDPLYIEEAYARALAFVGFRDIADTLYKFIYRAIRGDVFTSAEYALIESVANGELDDEPRRNVNVYVRTRTDGDGACIGSNAA